jgi:hypothetical protein
LASRIKFSQFSHFSVFSQEKRPLHMVRQKQRYGKLMPVNQGFICMLVWSSITCFACEDLASRIKMSQFTHFFCVFLGKKTLIKRVNGVKWWKKGKNRGL